MSIKAQLPREDESYGCVFSLMKPRQWVQIGKSYFMRTPHSFQHAPNRAKRIELNEKFMVFAFYCSGRGGNEELLAYEVRPLIPPELEVVGTALFLKYSDDIPSSREYTKKELGDEGWALRIAECENGDVMFTLG